MLAIEVTKTEETLFYKKRQQYLNEIYFSIYLNENPLLHVDLLMSI